MQKDIIRLRREESLSLSEISDRLGIAKSTVSKYCKNIKPKNPERLVKKQSENAIKGSLANKIKADGKKTQQRAKAIKRWKALKDDPKFTLFWGLYLGEGRKCDYAVRIANNNPDIIKIAYDSFLWIWPECRLQALVKFYDSHDETKCFEFWERLLPKAEITTKKVTDKRIKEYYWCDRCPFGLCDLGFNDVLASVDINEWMIQTSSLVVKH